ncbi:MAG: YraN family protein [Candidatus Omnitrophica bacterium]|nr:YraN family protein [Candidatus Omnitrophota bacterium]
MNSSQPKPPFRISLGDRGEMVGAAYLVRNGYKILEKNYRCLLGEIDIVAEKGERIIFVEIKTRNSEMFGRPEEAVHSAKQRKLIQLAKWYLKDKKLWDRSAGFAVLAVSWKAKSDPEIRLIEDAFEL